MSNYVLDYERGIIKKQVKRLSPIVIILVGLIIFFAAGATEEAKFIDLNSQSDIAGAKGEYFTMAIGTLSDFYAEDTDGTARYSLTFLGDKLVTVKIPSYDSRKAQQIINYTGEKLPEAYIMNTTGRIMAINSELKGFAHEYINYSMGRSLSSEQLDELLWPYVLDIGAPIASPGAENAMVYTLVFILLTLIIIVVLGTMKNLKKFRRQVEKYVTSPREAEAFDREMAEEPILNYKDQLKVTKNWIIIAEKLALYRTAIKIEDVVCVFPEVSTLRTNLFIRVKNPMVIFRTADNRYHQFRTNKEEAMESLAASIQRRLPWVWKENHHKGMNMSFSELTETVREAREEYLKDNGQPGLVYEG